MRVYRLSVKTCALLSALAALLAPARPRAASCCGGGGGGATVLPRGARAMADLAVEWERYDGYWDASGQHKADPAGSSLAQYRATLALAGRLATRWQAGVTLPYVWNANRYSGLSSRTRGLGDTAVSLWYEAFDERSAWRVASAADLLPSVTAGLSLTIPTGLSPYDDVASSFDVTGRGFYRVDGNLQLDKSYRAFSASVALGYGVFLDRPVNRFYGRWVEPYHKHMGPRASASGSLGYRYFIGTGGDALTLTAGVAWLRERQGTLGGAPDPASGMRKASFSATLAWSSTDADWTARLGWSRAPAYDGWGSNFPSTDVFSLGVRRVLP